MSKKKFSLNFKDSAYKTEWSLLLILVLCFFGLGMLRPHLFFSANNIRSIAFQMPEFGILSLAMMAVIITGGINLAVVTTGTFASIVGALILSGKIGGMSAWLTVLIAIVVMLVIAFLAGVLNAYFVAVIGVPALLGTLGTSAVFEGIGLKLTMGGAISGFPAQFMAIGNESFLGIPIPMWIYAVVIVISYLMIQRSVWGVNLHMVGSNPVATEYSGVNTKWVIAKSFLYSAFMSVLAGIIMMSRYNSAKSDYGSSYMLQSVTAAVLGGASIYGGTGSVPGVVISVAIIQVVTTGLNIVNVDRNLVDIAIGAILIGVLILRHFSDVRANRKLIKQRQAASKKAA